MDTETAVWIRQHIPCETGKSKANKELRDKKLGYYAAQEFTTRRMGCQRRLLSGKQTGSKGVENQSVDVAPGKAGAMREARLKNNKGN